MKKVILLPEDISKNDKPIQLTHRKQGGGWKGLSPLDSKGYTKYATKIVYLGECRQDGDMFALYDGRGYIMIFKGVLNSGTY